MFRRVEVRHYKLLKRVDVRLERMNILVGPNASGKSTLLDVFAFLQTALNDDVETAVRARTMGNALHELVWRQALVEQGIEFALEIDIPVEMKKDGYDVVRYELNIGLDSDQSLTIKSENVFLMKTEHEPPNGRHPETQTTWFPTEIEDKEAIVRPVNKQTPKGYKKIM